MGAWRVGLALLGLLLVVAVALAGFFSPSLQRRGRVRGARVLSGAALVARLLLAVAGVGLLYALFIEADWLEVTTVEIDSPKLPKGTRLELAVVSDLHVAHDTRALVALRNELTKRPVDLVVFTGDAINQRDALGVFRATLVSLGGRLGRAAVKGRDDALRWKGTELFSGVATELLSDRPVVLDEGRLALCGAPWGATELVEACLAAAPADAVSVFVYHSPELVEALEHRPDVYLSGRASGPPLLRALDAGSAPGAAYDAGRFEVRGTTLVVSRGIGFAPGAPPVRLGGRPQLVRVVLVGTGGASPR